MKRTAILCYNKIGPRSILATCRIATYLAEMLDADLIHDPDQFKEWYNGERKLYDNILIVNGIPTYCKARVELYAMITEHCAAQKNVYHIGNDYNLQMRPQAHEIKQMLANPNFKLVAAFDREAWKCYTPDEEQYKYINWNMLTYVPGMKMVPTEDTKPDSMLYYGAARKGRSLKFRQYFAAPEQLNVHLGMPSSLATGALCRVMGWEEDVPANVHWEKAFGINSVHEQIAEYGCLLYIEDEANKEMFFSLANRFYEYLSSGTLMVIDRDCIENFVKSGFDRKLVELFAVSSPEDVLECLKHREELLEIQHNEMYLATNYREVLDAEVIQFFTEEGVI